MKKLPIGIQAFQKIRESDYAYVDKTGLAVDLISRYQYVFLSRPRRFGKSLLVDTLDNLFSAKKELFTGLAAETVHDWTRKYPVIKISFSEGSFRTPKSLEKSLLISLAQNENKLGVQGQSDIPALRFAEIIRAAAEKYRSSAVILIDEYDKPILDNISSPAMAQEARDSLRDFYSSIKSNDASIRFAFLTGVSKFSKVSIFSGINNIVDISLEKNYGSICGYTSCDLQTVFAEHLQGVDMEQLALWYDGYNFLGEHVYNPFDILLFLAKDKIFRNYWFETGTPTFLIKLLQQKRFFLPELGNIKAGEELLSSFDIDNIAPIPLLFQTGYLTIQEIQQRGTFISYTLGFPNLEVSAAFNNALLDLFAKDTPRTQMQMDIYFALEDGDMEQFKKAIHGLFASISYHNYTGEEIARYEGFYASVIYAWLASSRLLVKVEDSTNKGRIDMTIEMDETIYIIEFKVDISGEAAISQIKEKGYTEKYQTCGKKVVLIGISFSSEEKNVIEFVWKEELSS